jgi:hypothetical protein
VTFPVVKSPRVQRRVLWAGSLVAVAGTFGILDVTLPRGGSYPNTVHPGRPELVSEPQSVPLTPARRAAINRLVDDFVPAAVERRDPLRALPLVTQAFRAGTTRKDWANGNLPVIPYETSGRQFHGWTLDYSLADQIAVDVLLRPGPRETRGAIAFTAVFMRPHGTWLIDSFVPAASFAPDNAKTKRIYAQPDYAPTPKIGS